MSRARETLDLEAFLADLPEDAAARARAAAAQIDALEREIGPPGWIERHLVVLIWVAGTMFALGILGLAAGLAGWFGLGGVVILVAGFPVLIFAYLLTVKGRTRRDEAKMMLNEKHFLPHGGIYFGAPQGGGSVLRVAVPEANSETGGETEPDLRAKVRAQYDAATTRQW